MLQFKVVQSRYRLSKLQECLDFEPTVGFGVLPSTVEIKIGHLRLHRRGHLKKNQHCMAQSCSDQARILTGDGFLQWGGFLWDSQRYRPVFMLSV